MQSLEQVRVGGVWLNDVSPWGDLTYSTAWPKGCDEASWSMYLRPGTRNDALHRGVLVEIFVGGFRVWVGRLAQADWSTGAFKADGLYVDGAFTALDGTGASTTIPATAVDQAGVRGAAWAGRVGVSTTALVSTDTVDAPNTVAGLLDADADLNGKRWGVFADAVLIMTTDPTEPTWHLVAGSVELGEDDSNYASRLQARYLRSTDSTYQTVSVEDAAAIALTGLVEQPIDLTGWGPLTTATATQIATNILAKSKAALGWANAIDVSAYQLTTPGGQSADLSMVQARQVVRAFDVWDGRRVLPYFDLLLGAVTRDTSSRTINLAPVDTQPQTLAEVIESMQPPAAGGFQA